MAIQTKWSQTISVNWMSKWIERRYSSVRAKTTVQLRGNILIGFSFIHSGWTSLLNHSPMVPCHNYLGLYFFGPFVSIVDVGHLATANFQSHFMEGHWVRLLCFVSANPTNVGNCRNGLGGRWTPPNTCTDSQLVVADDGIHAGRKVVRLCAVNSFAPGRFLWYFRWVIFMSILVIDDWHIFCEIAIKWM